MIFDDQIYFLKNHEYSSDEAHVLFMIGMSRRFRRTVFCSRVAPESKSANYSIPREIEICPLPYYENVRELCSKLVVYSVRIWRILRMEFAEWDFVLLSWPHPISLLILILIAVQQKQPVAILLTRQNLKQLVRLRYSGFRKLAAILMVNFLEWQFRLWGRNALILAVGYETYHDLRISFRHVDLVTLPLLSQNDLAESSSEDTRNGGATCRLLFVGRLEPEKGLPVLIRCVALLKAESKRVHLDIVGSGVEEGSLHKLIHDVGVTEDVTFHGYVPYGKSLFAHYHEADVFVLPSLSEGVPTVLLEAMAFGLPIIVSRVGGCKYVIKDRDNGLLVDPGSVSALSEAITELINNRELADEIRHRAKDDSSLYTMEAQQEKILAALVSYLEKVKGISGTS